MNLLPFDIEKVKAGAKFCFYRGEMQPEGFQITQYGIVVKWAGLKHPCLYTPEFYNVLRLLPEEREVWINVWKDKNGKIITLSFDTESKKEDDITNPNGYTHLETIHKTYTI